MKYYAWITVAYVAMVLAVPALWLGYLLGLHTQQIFWVPVPLMVCMAAAIVAMHLAERADLTRPF